jgi:hypothetical protein
MSNGVKEKLKGAMFYEKKNTGIISKWGHEHLCPCRIADI